MMEIYEENKHEDTRINIKQFTDSTVIMQTNSNCTFFGSVSKATFIRCSFENCTFNHTEFWQCNFIDCYFSQCRIVSNTWDNTTFIDCGIHNTKILSSVSLGTISFVGGSLIKLQIHDTNLSNLTGVHLKQCGDTSICNCVMPLSCACPDGEFILWKTCEFGTLVKLKVSYKSNRIKAFGTNVIRVSEAKVMGIYDSDGKLSEHTSVRNFVYLKNRVYYTLGELVTADQFDLNPFNVCSAGIHGYLSQKEVRIY